MRTIIDIPDNLLSVLEAEVKTTKLSRSELIRQAISLFVQERTNSRKSKDDVFGIWKKRKVDGLIYEQNLRKEWKE